MPAKILLFLGLSSLTFLFSSPSVFAESRFSSYSALGNNSIITPGDNNSVLMGGYFTTRISRVDETGVITRYENSPPQVIEVAAGPQNSVWYVKSGLPYVELNRIDANGNTTRFGIPYDRKKFGNANATRIVKGRDDSVWFGINAAKKDLIGKIASNGVVTQYELPSDNFYITSLASNENGDGSIYFTDYKIMTDSNGNESSAFRIGKISLNGDVTILPYTANTGIGLAGADGQGFVYAFTYPSDQQPYSLIKISNGSDISTITSLSSPVFKNFTAAKDGKVWYVSSDSSPKVSYINTDGAQGPVYTIPFNNFSSIGYITSTDNGLVWLVAQDKNDINKSVVVKLKTDTLAIPQVPANVVATNQVTNQPPQLSWQTMQNAASYSVFRDNVTTANVTTASYSDTTAQEGNHTYYITSVGKYDEDTNGQSSTVSVLVDKTPPTASNITLSGPGYVNKTVTALNPVTITANVSDALSGVQAAEYYIDSDPGKGAGKSMTINGAKATATLSTTGLTTGSHILYVRSKDAAGNWSTLAQLSFTYLL